MVAARIFRTCFRPAPCCGDRHGQCREQLRTSAQPGFCAVLTLWPGRIERMARWPSRMRPRPRVPAHNAELPHLLVLRARTAYAAVTQVEAQQVRVVSMRLRERSPISASGALGSQVGALQAGFLRHSRSVAWLIPVDMLLLRRLHPFAISA